MKKTIFDLSYEIFYETAQSSDNDLHFNLSDKMEYPKIEYTPKYRITVPKPNEIGGTYYLEGNVFENYADSQETIWSLYLATLYHLGAHAKVSDFNKYTQWLQDKTPEKGWKVIDFVEDIKVEQYLKELFPDAWQNMNLIKAIYDKSFNDKIESSKNYAREKFSKHFVKKSEEISELKETISQTDNGEFSMILPFLDYLYKNQHLLPEIILPYCKHNDFSMSNKNLIKNVTIQPKGEFESIVSKMDELWVAEKHTRDKWLREYQKFAENSNFDEIIISPDNYGEFLRISEDVSGDLMRVRNTIRAFSNILDSPFLEERGQLDLQAAVQRVASQNESIRYYEQDVPGLETDNWVLIMDSSASMKFKSDMMKKFALCLSDAAERIGDGGGKWGMYSFNNNFIIVKDHNEKFNQQIKARLGGLENKGLSFIPDAIEMGTRILIRDRRSTQKYLIVMSDYQSLGYDNADHDLRGSLQYAKRNRVNVIGIGVPDNLKKYFTLALADDNLIKSVKKFLSSYIYLSESQV